jgi:hypothetical protein
VYLQARRKRAKKLRQRLAVHAHAFAEPNDGTARDGPEMKILAKIVFDMDKHRLKVPNERGF